MVSCIGVPFTALHRLRAGTSLSVSKGLNFMLHMPYSEIPFFGISKEHANGGRFFGCTPLSSFFIGMSSMRRAAARTVRAEAAEADSCGVSVRAEAHAMNATKVVMMRNIVGDRGIFREFLRGRASAE